MLRNNNILIQIQYVYFPFKKADVLSFNLMNCNIIDFGLQDLITFTCYFILMKLIVKIL